VLKMRLAAGLSLDLLYRLQRSPAGPLAWFRDGRMGRGGENRGKEWGGKWKGNTKLENEERKEKERGRGEREERRRDMKER